MLNIKPNRDESMLHSIARASQHVTVCFFYNFAKVEILSSQITATATLTLFRDVRSGEAGEAVPHL